MKSRIEEAEGIAEKLELIPHPEGGYFREIYRNEEFIRGIAIPDRYEGERNYLTSIYYLLVGNSISKFHSLKSDEIWYFHSGSPVFIHTISTDGKYEKMVLGSNVLAGEKPQIILKKGIWFGAEISEKESYSFVGCAVSPGFDYRDFILADRTELISKYPAFEELISRLT